MLDVPLRTITGVPLCDLGENGSDSARAQTVLLVIRISDTNHRFELETVVEVVMLARPQLELIRSPGKVCCTGAGEQSHCKTDQAIHDFGSHVRSHEIDALCRPRLRLPRARMRPP